MAVVKLKEEEMNYESSEAYRSLRTNLQFCGDDKKTIVVTSCTPNEGKSTVLLHLAVYLADAGKKVLLVDGDLRKSVMLGFFDIDQEIRGLTHYLSGQAELPQVITQTDRENLEVIFCGAYPPNPTELLGGERFRDLLAVTRQQYDYVLVDCAPLGSVIDAAVVAKECDGSLLVVESECISRRFLQDIKQQLEKSGCPILGVVLNKVDFRRRRSYGGYYGKKYGRYYGKYYGYGQYGHYGQDQGEKGKK